MRTPASFKLAQFRRAVICASLLLVLLPGCSGKSSRSDDDFSAVLPSKRAPVSLTPKEAAILNVKGLVDAKLPEGAIEDVAVQYEYYLREGRKAIIMASKRSERFLTYARAAFRRRGMPEELANLAIVESGYRPDAVSRAGAAGAWQFMPATGAKYGLIQDAWVDERMDPFRSTEAAADYLQFLHSSFGDWPTAIAAYNAGEGKMSRAKTGTGGREFFEVKNRNHMLDDKAQLREETKQYVPKFLAVTKIMRHLPELGFEPINPQSAPMVVRLAAAPGTSLDELRRASAMSQQEFDLYNSHHRRGITSTERRTFVYVPSHAKSLASAYLSSSSAGSFAGWRLAQAPAADSLDRISKRGRISLAQLKTANPGVSRFNAGETLLLPPGTNLTRLAAAPAKSPANAKNTALAARGSAAASSNAVPLASSGRVHVVQTKDTLYSIARKHNVEVSHLMASNGIANPQALRVGAALKIPASSPAKAKTAR